MKLSKKLKSITSAIFHKRNIIIMSARSTSHVSMSGKMQFIMVVGIIGLISMGSYSTGKYMAAQKVIDEQGETIKSVANSRIESNYSYGVPSLSSQTVEAIQPAEVAENTTPITDPSYTFSGIDESKLISRISYLENRIKELKKNNDDIINVVKTTADGQIKDLELIISQTGLSPELLKRQAQQENKIRKKPAATASSADGSGGQGGPYIPANWDNSMRAFVDDLDKSADQLYVLRQILKVMPLAKPIQGASRESTFGRRVDPFNRRIAFHSGLDLASSKPQITAPVAGKVSFAGWSGGYGNMVEVQHGLGISTRYGHLSQILVNEGEVVTQGQLLGIQGSTGRSTGPHLHYEVRFNDRAIDPAPFLNVGSKYVSKK